jgi:uracil-DNA glycosylase family 4
VSAGTDSLDRIRDEVVECRACPRLVEWRERVAHEKVTRFADQEYWGKPVPSFGDRAAQILILGLAPAAHGGNRTGRIFTGDQSGDFLFASLHRTGFANQPISVARDDGLQLECAYVTAVNRCAPPQDRPTVEERDRCLPYLEREIRAMPSVTVIATLGKRAWEGALLALSAVGHEVKPRPKFGHLAEARVGPFILLGSYHPSPRNTNTGVLTPAMLDEVFERARDLAGC